MDPPSEQENQEVQQAKLLEQAKAAMVAQARAFVEAEIRAMDDYEREHGESSPSGPARSSSLLPCLSCVPSCLIVRCIVAGSIKAFFHLAREVYDYYWAPRSRSRPTHQKTE